MKESAESGNRIFELLNAKLDALPTALTGTTMQLSDLLWKKQLLNLSFRFTILVSRAEFRVLTALLKPKREINNYYK